VPQESVCPGGLRDQRRLVDRASGSAGEVGLAGIAHAAVVGQVRYGLLGEERGLELIAQLPVVLSKTQPRLAGVAATRFR
jgi:hypothetical protein